VRYETGSWQGDVREFGKVLLIAAVMVSPLLILLWWLTGVCRL